MAAAGREVHPPRAAVCCYTRLRYFDPARRRAGLPQDVAALVDSWGPDSLTLTLINISPSVARSVIVQGGAYGEHQIVSVSDGKATMDVNAPNFPVRLAPGAGAKLTIRMKRFANDPTLSFPWEDTVADLGSPPDIPQYAHKSSGFPDGLPSGVNRRLLAPRLRKRRGTDGCARA